jgi:hypothetical protein
VGLAALAHDANARLRYLFRAWRGTGHAGHQDAEPFLPAQLHADLQLDKVAVSCCFAVIKQEQLMAKKSTGGAAKVIDDFKKADEKSDAKLMKSAIKKDMPKGGKKK